MTEYFYPPDSNVFALTNLPEVVKGALFSRYSRSPDGIKDILHKEFLTEGEGKAAAFYDRVLGAYGDDSVAELGNAHIAIEGMSDLLATEILSSRIGISPLAKSTRYVDFGAAVSPYYLSEYIKADPVASQLYRATMDDLFVTYNRLLLQVVEALKHRYPVAGSTLAAYDRSIKAKALDLIRGLLPVGTLTNLGLCGNGRAFEYLIVKLNALDYPEALDVAAKLKVALDGSIAPFVKRSTEPRGVAYSEYLRDLEVKATDVVPGAMLWSAGTTFGQIACGAKLVKWNPLAEDDVIEGILYPASNRPFVEVEGAVASLNGHQKWEILNDYASGRTSRHLRPGRALEMADYTFEVIADIGAYRDLHRHRLTTELRQDFSADLSFEVPTELKSLGGYFADDYQLALESAGDAWRRLSERAVGLDADYLLPMAYRVRWLHKMNLREAVHLIELRSQPAGHIGYRQIAWAMADEIIRVNPLLESQLRFVDRSVPELGRLVSETKLDAKIANR